jgi:hypothetical protein
MNSISAPHAPRLALERGGALWHTAGKSVRCRALLGVERRPAETSSSLTPPALEPSRGRVGDSGCCRKRRKEEKMAKLTDTQLVVLSKAAAREDGAAIVPLRMNKAAAVKIGQPGWHDDRLAPQGDSARDHWPIRTPLVGVPGWYSWNHDRDARSAFALNLFLAWNRAFKAETFETRRHIRQRFDLDRSRRNRGGCDKISRLGCPNHSASRPSKISSSSLQVSRCFAFLDRLAGIVLLGR